MAQFEVAVDMMGEKKYPRDPRASSKIRSKLTSGTGPSTHPGATVRTEYCNRNVLQLHYSLCLYSGSVFAISIADSCNRSSFGPNDRHFQVHRQPQAPVR